MLTSKDDLNVSIIKTLLQTPMVFDPRDVPDPYTQYVKHFIYMVKRNEKAGNQLHVYEDDDIRKNKK